MRVGQYGSRKPKNLVGGGKRGSSNEFNSGMKRERRPDPPQYASSKVEERKRFSETRDARPDRSSSGNRSSSASSSGKNSSGKSSSGTRSGGGNPMSKFVQQAVGMTAGAVVVTTSYQDMVEAREAERAAAMNVPEIVETIEQDPAYDDYIGDNVENIDSNEETYEDDSESSDDDEVSDVDESASANQEPVPALEIPANPQRPVNRQPVINQNVIPSLTQTAQTPTPSTNGERSFGENANALAEAENSDEESGDTTTQYEVGSLEWEWNEESATLLIVDVSGRKISVPAVVTTEETPASCTKDGKVTYSAVAEYENNNYTDTQTEKITATGHHIGEGKVTSDGAKTVCEFQCENCGEKFVVEITIDEDD